MNTADLLKKHKIYNNLIHQYDKLEMAYLGGTNFKQDVRKKRPSEDSALWRDLIENTVSMPICRYIVDTINDVLFEPGVDRTLNFVTPQGTLIPEQQTQWANLFVMDADFNNSHLNAFMETVGDLTSIYGHCYVAVDMPENANNSLGRPYVVAINPKQVWDWEYDYYGGRPILKYVKVMEMEDDSHYYIKCYHLGTATLPSSWKCYKIAKGDINKPATLHAEGTFPPGMAIPVFIAHGKKDPRRFDVGVSDIDNASDAQREYYKLECEAYNSVQFAHTLIRAEAGIKVPVHAGAIVRGTKDQVEAIEVKTSDVDTIIKKQQDILENIEGLTGLGGLRMNASNTRSGIAIIEERKQIHRLAKAKARNMETVEELIFTFAARFMNMRWAGEINYDTNYEEHDTNYRMALMKEAKTLTDNQMVADMITKEVIGMLAPQEGRQIYQNAFVDTLQDVNVKTVMVEADEIVSSRDLEEQMVPNSEEEYERKADLMATDVAIQNTGPSYTPEQGIAVALLDINGR